MINFAHRGASYHYPENTILAFSEAIKMGCSGIELDVHKSKDNKLVVIHDENIQRTYLGNGLVKDFTVEQLKSFKCIDKRFIDDERCKIPTLEEVLELIKDTKLLLNIELKTDEIEYEGIEEDVLKLIYKYNIKDRVIISSFNHDSLKKCRELDSEIKLGALYSKDIDNVVEYAKNIKVNALHPKVTLISKELVDKAHENNLSVNVYTVDYKIVMKKLINMNIDGIFTNKPDVLSKILDSKK